MDKENAKIWRIERAKMVVKEAIREHSNRVGNQVNLDSDAAQDTISSDIVVALNRKGLLARFCPEDWDPEE